MSLSGFGGMPAVIAVAAALFLAASAQAQYYYPEPGANTPPPATSTMPRTDRPGTTTIGTPTTTTPLQAVFLRAGPSTDAPVIGTLQPGMQLDILASANHGWMAVRSPVGTGWTFGSYLASGVSGTAQPNAGSPEPGMNEARRPDGGNPPPPITSP